MSQELFKKLKNMNLPIDQYVVFGSGPLAIRGFRDSNDLDVLVTMDLWSKLKREPSSELEISPNGSQCLRNGSIYIYTDWKPGNMWNEKEIISNSEIIQGIPFAKLEYVLKYKLMMKREKDIEDINFIKKYFDIDKIKYTKSAGGVVLNTEGRVLVVSQGGKTWSFPKGHIDEGEEALDAAKREIYEESGVKQLEFIKELGSYDRYRMGEYGGDDLSELKNISIFLFKTNEKDLKPLDSYHPEARWLEKENVADLLTHKKDKEFFLSVKERI